MKLDFRTVKSGHVIPEGEEYAGYVYILERGIRLLVKPTDEGNMPLDEALARQGTFSRLPSVEEFLAIRQALARGTLARTFKTANSPECCFYWTKDTVDRSIEAEGFGDDIYRRVVDMDDGKVYAFSRLTPKYAVRLVVPCLGMV